jgi:DNA-binding ferritin-like protein
MEMENEQFKVFVEIYENFEKENNQRTNSLYKDPYYNSLHFSLEKLYMEKYKHCDNIFEMLKSSSSNPDINKETYINEETQIEGKEREFIKRKFQYTECISNIKKLEQSHQQNISNIYTFMDMNHNKCINGCKLINERNEIENCLKECFKSNFYNTEIGLELIAGEMHKYLNSLKKI